MGLIRGRIKGDEIFYLSSHIFTPEHACEEWQY
jgi:hypothetical protein